MKKISYLLLIAVLFLLNYCTSDFIDLEPKGRVSDVSLFSSSEGALQALTGCYDVLGRDQTYRRLQYELGDCLSDDSEVGGKAGNYQHPAAQDLSRFIASSANELSEEYWEYQYLGIGRCNEVLQRVPDIEMDENLKKRILAEARFLRALYYFNLNVVFGGVPIVDHPLLPDEYYSVPRATRIEVFQFIVDNLLAARNDLPLNYDAANVGRATKGAANALLAKTYLFMASYKDYDTYIEWNGQGFDALNTINADDYWQLAKETAELVINSGEYELIQGVFTRFKGETYEYDVHAFAWIFTLEGNNCKEKIFEVQHYDGLSGTGGNYHEGDARAKWTLVRDAIAPDGSAIPNPGFGFNCPTQDLFDAFENNDIRREITITTDEDSILWEHNDQIVWCKCDHRQSPTGYAQGKVRVMPLELFGGGGTYPSTQSGINICVLRYADVLLIHAEACMELGLNDAAKNDLKAIRNRVGLSDYPEDPEYANLREAIYHERRVELAMEQQRWFDLVRWGRVANELIGTAYGDNFQSGKHEFLPVHEGEVLISKGSIKQNQGY